MNGNRFKSLFWCRIWSDGPSMASRSTLCLKLSFGHRAANSSPICRTFQEAHLSIKNAIKDSGLFSYFYRFILCHYFYEFSTISTMKLCICYPWRNWCVRWKSETKFSPWCNCLPRRTVSISQQWLKNKFNFPFIASSPSFSSLHLRCYAKNIVLNENILHTWKWLFSIFLLTLVLIQFIFIKTQK